MHEDRDIETVERELRANGFLKEDVTVDLDALHAYLAPLAEPSRVESFKFNREWLRAEASRVTDIRSAAVGRRLNLPPSYVLIHRVSTAGIGVLCQLECEGEFRAEVLRWIPGYLDEAEPLPAEDGPGATAGAESLADGLGTATDSRDGLRTATARADDPPDDMDTATDGVDYPWDTWAPRPRARAARRPDLPCSTGRRPFCGRTAAGHAMESPGRLALPGPWFAPAGGAIDRRESRPVPYRAISSLSRIASR